MAKEQNPAEEMNAFAHQAKEQAMAAADSYFNFLKKAISAYPSSGNAFGDSMKGYAERNVAAMHEFVQRLGQARDFQDALRIQAEFMQSQFTALTEQTKSLGESYARSASDVINRTTKL